MLVIPTGCGGEGAVYNEATTVLTYRARFENVGTGAAHFVYIRNYLDASAIDISTLRLLRSSHNVTDFQVAPGGELVISFRDIELQSMEQGYVFFSVNLHDDLADGTPILNFADIFFDRMPPVGVCRRPISNGKRWFLPILETCFQVCIGAGIRLVWFVSE